MKLGSLRLQIFIAQITPKRLTQYFLPEITRLPISLRTKLDLSKDHFALHHFLANVASHLASGTRARVRWCVERSLLHPFDKPSMAACQRQANGRNATNEHCSFLLFPI